jgi:hypothetical protein
MIAPSCTIMMLDVRHTCTACKSACKYAVCLHVQALRSAVRMRHVTTCPSCCLPSLSETQQHQQHVHNTGRCRVHTRFQTFAQRFRPQAGSRCCSSSCTAAALPTPLAFHSTASAVTLIYTPLTARGSHGVAHNSSADSTSTATSQPNQFHMPSCRNQTPCSCCQTPHP